MHYLDFVFLFALFVIQPIYGAMTSRKLYSSVAAGVRPNRISLFNETMMMQWGAFLVLGIAWSLLDRPLASLGVRSSSVDEMFIGLGAMVLLLAVLVYSLYYVRKLTGAEKTRQQEAVGAMIHYLPQTKSEYQYSTLVSITAGIVEEIVYRGYVIWILSIYLPIWVAVLISSVGFGLAHCYQGISGSIKTGLAGLVFAGLYVVTGSIWVPILAHIAIDILQLATVRELFIERDVGRD